MKKRFIKVLSNLFIIIIKDLEKTQIKKRLKEEISEKIKSQNIFVNNDSKNINIKEMNDSFFEQLSDICFRVLDNRLSNVNNDNGIKDDKSGSSLLKNNLKSNSLKLSNNYSVPYTNIELSKEYLIPENKTNKKNSNSKYLSENVNSNYDENVNLSYTPNQDFLLNSTEMDLKLNSLILNKNQEEREILTPNKKPDIKTEQMAMSDYYDNVFNSFLEYTQSQMKNSNSQNKLSGLSTLKKSSNNKKIEMSSGLSEYLKSKLDSYIEDFQKDNQYKKGTIESMIRKNSSKILKSDFTNTIEPKEMKTIKEEKTEETNDLFRNNLI